MSDLLERALEWAAESALGDIAPVIKRLSERHKPEVLEAVLASARADRSRPGLFDRGLIRADALPAAVEPSRLWFGLYPGTFVLFVGETGAGKSSVLYNIVAQAAMNQAAWGVPFGLGRPVRVLYVDPENSGNWDEGVGGQCSRKLERIMGAEWVKPPTLWFHDGRHWALGDASACAELAQWLKANQVDICILDPIANLFGTQDENDNAEAARHMRSIVSVSRESGACVVAVHHTGKDSTGNYGRGASARLAAADVGLILRARGPADDYDDDYAGALRERDDVCRLQVVKNRLEGRASLYLRMAGNDRFERVGFKEWKDAARPAGDPHVSQLEQAREEIVTFLQDGAWHTRTEIVDAMRKEHIGRNSVDEALQALVDADTVTMTRKGKGGTLLYILGTFPVSRSALGESGNRETSNGGKADQSEEL